MTCGLPPHLTGGARCAGCDETLERATRGSPYHIAINGHAHYGDRQWCRSCNAGRPDRHVPLPLCIVCHDPLDGYERSGDRMTCCGPHGAAGGMLADCKWCGATEHQAAACPMLAIASLLVDCARRAAERDPNLLHRLAALFEAARFETGDSFHGRPADLHEPRYPTARVRRWAARASSGAGRRAARPVTFETAKHISDTLFLYYPAGHRLYFHHYGPTARSVYAWVKAGRPPLDPRSGREADPRWDEYVANKLDTDSWCGPWPQRLIIENPAEACYWNGLAMLEGCPWGCAAESYREVWGIK